MTGHYAGLTHWCSAISEGEESLSCKTGWACTIEDGRCEGSTRCGACLSEDLSSMSEERADSYLDALERLSDNDY